jgi:hypothetical protein
MATRKKSLTHNAESSFYKRAILYWIGATAKFFLSSGFPFTQQIRVLKNLIKEPERHLPVELAPKFTTVR